MTDIQDELLEIIDKKDILINEPMKKHTSFKIGGPADYFITIRSIADLKKIQKFTIKKNIPFTIIGNGTNLLVLDKGIRGIVAKLNFNKIEFRKNIVIVSGDVPVSKLARICAEKNLSGIEFLVGIPGTVGGAIKMNAGAYGSEIKDVVKYTKCLDENENIIELSNEEHEFEYRKSIFFKKKYIILETEFSLKNDNYENINLKMDEMLETRRKKQPLEYPSAGSTFKRNKSTITAKLIDECGLKCFTIGGASVSEKHAGFIINKGNATAKDVLDLAEYIKKVVYQKFKEEIELEIEVIGEC